MEHIKQNHPDLNPLIRSIGCFFRSACLLAEIETGKSLTTDNLNNLWTAAKAVGYIDENDDVRNSAAIANMALQVLKAPGRFIEVAVRIHGRVNWYAGVDMQADYFIKKIMQNGPSKTHFIVVDAAGQLIEDPHEPAIKEQGEYYTIYYRYRG